MALMWTMDSEKRPFVVYKPTRPDGGVFESVAYSHGLFNEGEPIGREGQRSTGELRRIFDSFAPLFSTFQPDQLNSAAFQKQYLAQAEAFLKSNPNVTREQLTRGLEKTAPALTTVSMKSRKSTLAGDLGGLAKFASTVASFTGPLLGGIGQAGGAAGAAGAGASAGAGAGTSAGLSFGQQVALAAAGSLISTGLQFAMAKRDGGEGAPEGPQDQAATEVRTEDKERINEQRRRARIGMSNQLNKTGPTGSPVSGFSLGGPSLIGRGLNSEGLFVS
jgi:hypothetical protein